MPAIPLNAMTIPTFTPVGADSYFCAKLCIASPFLFFSTFNVFLPHIFNPSGWPWDTLFDIEIKARIKNARQEIRHLLSRSWAMLRFGNAEVRV